MRKIARSPRQALDLAIERGCTIEAIHNYGIKTRSAAEAKVPPGGLLVKQDDGTFVAMDLIPIPNDDPDTAALARHLKGGAR